MKGPKGDKGVGGLVDAAAKGKERDVMEQKFWKGGWGLGRVFFGDRGLRSMGLILAKGGLEGGRG